MQRLKEAYEEYERLPGSSRPRRHTAVSSTRSREFARLGSFIKARLLSDHDEHASIDDGLSVLVNYPNTARPVTLCVSKVPSVRISVSDFIVGHAVLQNPHPSTPATRQQLSPLPVLRPYSNLRCPLVPKKTPHPTFPTLRRRQSATCLFQEWPGHRILS